MQQHVVLANAVEDVRALGQSLAGAGNKGAELHVRAVNAVRHLHQADKIHRAVHAVEIDFLEVELGEQELGHRLRTVVGHL